MPRRTKSHNSKGGVPAVRGNSRDALADVTRHRANAIIGQALDLIVEGKGEKDPAKRLAEEYYRAPMAFIDWVNERCGGSAQPSQGAAVAAGLAGVFGAAAAIAASANRPSSPSGEVVDAEFAPVPSEGERVQSGSMPEQPIDNEW